jgi:hypothetical protein
VFVGLSIGHAAALLTMTSVPLVAIGLWWNANTIAHNFIHRPFFRARAANRVFSAFLSLLLGVPQTVWRERHLAHHADRPVRIRLTPWVAAETMLILAAWTVAAAAVPATFLFVYLPGWTLGLALCSLQGYYEHARGTTSHYGRVYNLIFFNDGYHVEHHARPGEHWSQLPQRRALGRASRFPPVLRWLDAFSLDGLERLVLISPVLQRFVLGTHEAALRRLLPLAGRLDRVVIVGGGLYPRTALVLRRLFPAAAVTVLEADPHNAAIARRFLDEGTTIRHVTYRGEPMDDVDLVVIPLAYIGNRGEVYAHPPARQVLVHDWIWRRRGRGAIVSAWLLKRVNLIVNDAGMRAGVVPRSA